MSIRVLTRDTEALPDDLLSPAKEHMRVDHSEENNFIKSCIARAIANIEQRNEVTINPTTVLWTISAASFVSGAVSVPVTPAESAVVMSGEDDVSTDYSLALKWGSIHGVPIMVLEGSAAALSATLTCGFDSIDTLPPALLDKIMRITAHLYEHREILIPGREFVAPDYLLDATWWVPRA
jgi:hypothetical protein